MPLNTVPELARAASERLDLMDDRLGVLEMVPQGGGPLREYYGNIDWVLCKSTDSDERNLVARPAATSGDPLCDWVPEGFEYEKTLSSSRPPRTSFTNQNWSGAVYTAEERYATTKFRIPDGITIKVDAGFESLFSGVNGLSSIDDMGRVDLTADTIDLSNLLNENAGVGNLAFLSRYKGKKVSNFYNIHIAPPGGPFWIRDLDFSDVTAYTGFYRGLCSRDAPALQQLAKAVDGYDFINSDGVSLTISNFFGNNTEGRVTYPAGLFATSGLRPTQMEGFFRNFYLNSTNSSILSAIDYSRVTSLTSLFSNSSISGDLGVDIDMFSSSVVSATSFMRNATINSGDFLRRVFNSNADTSSVRSFSYFFSYMESFSGGTGSWPQNIDTSGASDLSGMFMGNAGFTATFGSYIKNWDVSNVTNMSYMFRDCHGLTRLYGIDSWDVSKVTDVTNFASGCYAMTDLSVFESWGSKLPENCKGIASMFANIPSSVQRPSWFDERRSADPGNPESPNYDPVFDVDSPSYDPDAVWDGPDVFTVR